MEDDPDAVAAERPSFAVAFRVDDWIVEPALNRITRGGKSVRVRPQLIDLLVLLAGRPGEVVTREAIFEAVWPGQFVAETGLTRCISQLRDLFDDDPRDPRIIETISKRGYRLVADVRPVDPAAVSSSTVGVASTSPAVPPAPADGPGVRSPAAPAEPTSTLTRRLRRHRRAIMLAAASLGVIVAAAVLWRAFRPSPLGEQDTLLVAFENKTGDPVFDDALRLALTIQLEQSPYLRVVSEQRIRGALELMNRRADEPVTRATAMELCQRVGARAVLTGSITGLGGHYVIGLEGAECTSGRTLARRQIEVDRKETIIEALGRVASDMRRGLGESVASIERHDVPLVQATTSSLDALKALTAGDLERSRGRDAEALEAYRRAIELDPQFALAHGRIGVHLLSLTRTGEAIDALKRAFELRRRTSAAERLYITSYYYTRVVRDPFKAIAALETWRNAYPRNPTPRVSLGSMYIQVGRFADALSEGREALRLSPGDASATAVVVEAMMDLERLDEAKRIADALLADGRGNITTHLLLLQIAFAQGDAEGVRRQTAWAASNPAAESLFGTHRASIALFGGQMNEGTRLWQERAQRAEARGDHALAALTTAGAAMHAAFAGSAGEVARLSSSALSDPKSPETVLRCALAFALVGQIESAERLMGDYFRMADVEDGSDPEYRAPIRALIEIQRGRPDSAIELLAPLASFEFGSRFDGIPAYVRGLAHLGAGRPRGAVAELAAITSHRGVLSNALIYPLTWRQLGRARVAAGDLAGARQAYTRFLDYWKDADPDVPALAQARAELGALR